MSIQSVTDDYERWLGTYVPLVAADLRHKHEKMASEDSALHFLRATFYRWTRKLPKVCPEVMDAPAALIVGDLHVENFGTWRDAEGRLVWGINDFDESWDLPYTNDLVRLAASAILARRDDQLSISERQVCEAVFDGYCQGIVARVDGNAAPFVVDEHHQWLLPLATGTDRAKFWERLRKLPPPKGGVPKDAIEALRRSLPVPAKDLIVRTRTTGVGSLGRPRFCVVIDWDGGSIAREAKALAPSACAWAKEEKRAVSRIDDVLGGAVRARDPFYRVDGDWVVRRLSPACDKIPLSAAAKLGDAAHLLHAMGEEAANVHVGDRRTIRAIQRDLDKRPRRWLRNASAAMVECTLRDREKWIQFFKQSVERRRSGTRSAS